MGWIKTALDKTDMRKAGDAARDMKDWAEAERAYGIYLESAPTDHAIWIQLGHSAKEQGKLDEAEKAYRAALNVQPDDPDAYLQLGHLLKRVGRITEAAEFFSSLLQKSGSREAYTELAVLSQDEIGSASQRMMVSSTLSKTSTIIELDDLLGFLEAHKTLSGIQRVQIGVIQHILALPANKSSANYMFVLNPLNENRLWGLSNSDLAEIASYVTGAYVDHDRLKRLVSNARRNAFAVSAASGQVYLILGAFWGYGGVANRYFHLKRQGVVVAAYIYDIIPITHTEYCDEGLPHEFTLSFCDGLSVFDFVLTISEYTAREVARYQTNLGMPPLPLRAVLLAHSDGSTMSQPSIWTSSIAHLRDRSFVLMVSTIEARKNHGYLVSIWKQFVDEGLDPPDLVFVGRVGWRVTSLMEMLETSRYLDGRVHVLHDLSDTELNTLYSECDFTAFPSFVEGWGLPVGESLARGKPCVASSTSSIPEVGGDFVDYVDPKNISGGYEVFKKMAFDARYRAQRAARIVNDFKPRTWRDVGANLLEQVESLRKSVKQASPPEPLFEPGVVFQPGDLALGNRLPRDYALHPMRLMLVDSWYGIEALGCWMADNTGTLQFRTNLPAGTPIVVYLKLYSPGFLSKDHFVEVGVGKALHLSRRRVSQLSVSKVRVGTAFLVKAAGVVEDDGTVFVGLRVTEKADSEDGQPTSRRFVIGLGSIAYASKADLASRVEILDGLLFDILG
jgi:glycosyltransferase involved in cell wall biosynthesis